MGARQAGALGRAAAITLAAMAPAMASGCNDEVHDEQVKALGGEAPGVSPGPLHRPGQPCLVCHGGIGPASARFSVAGTVFAVEGSSQPAVGATAQIEDVDGVFWTGTTNAAGNFYVLPSSFTPHYPTYNQVTSADGSKNQGMVSLVNREGSCAACHTSTRGPDSQGPIYLTVAPPDGGGP